MNIVEFIEKCLNYHLLEYQKNLLYKIEQNPLSRTNSSDIHTNHEGYSVDFIFIDELEPENKKED